MVIPSEKRLLNAQLSDLAETIDEQMNVVEREAHMKGVHPSELMYSDGQYILPPLLVAMAQVLNARVHLNKN